MTDLTIKELQQKRALLEADLATIIQGKLNQFAADTGVSIESVSVNSHDVTEYQDKSRQYFYSVSVDLDI